MKTSILHNIVRNSLDSISEYYKSVTMEKLLQTGEQHEKIISKIELYFSRHGEKQKGDGRPNEEIELTEKGIEQAREGSEGKDMSHSLAFGSSSKRTQQTAGFKMAGNLDDITGKESLAELREKLDKDLKVGSKIGVDRRLNPGEFSETNYDKVADEAFSTMGYLKFLVEQSDELAKQLSDSKAETYSRMASRIAGIVEKYIEIAPRWDVLVRDDQKKYSDTLKRFLSTHQGIGESFLAKVIEKTHGIETRDAFVAALDNQGFEFAEGFQVQLKNTSQGTLEIEVSFRKEKDGKTSFEYNGVVSQDIIRAIASD